MRARILFGILAAGVGILLAHVPPDLLPLNPQACQILTPAEKQRVFETASTKPEWQSAHCAALLTANTSARQVELRRLLWRDLDPVNRLMVVRRSKSDAGSRIILLNDEAWAAFCALKSAPTN
jgi:integrase